MCTVLLRFAPDEPWPVLLAAVRDEFVERPWDPPAAYWSDGFVGGRDRVAGGTWLAVDRAARAAAVVLNGERLPLLGDGVRPSRGQLPLDVLAGVAVPADVSHYDGFHLLHATPARVGVVTWNGSALVSHELAPGDHVIVNAGPDAVGDPVSARGRELLAGTSGDWREWLELVSGQPVDARDRLLVRHDFEGRTYGSTSVAVVGLSRQGARYDFSSVPASPETWVTVLADPMV